MTTETVLSNPAAGCVTLAEFRIEVLGMKQSELALRAKCKQAWISQVESGHLPKPWSRGRLLQAYGLERWEREFVRMVQGSAIEKAMLKTMDQTDPLFALGHADRRAEINRLVDQFSAKARQA